VPLGDCAVRVSGREPLYPVGVRFVCREFGPLVGHFVALDALVARAPADLYPDIGFLGPEGGDVSPGLEGVLLSWSWFIGGHSAHGRLAVCEDRYQTERVVPGCRCLQCSCESSAFGVKCFLTPAHMGLVAFPR